MYQTHRVYLCENMIFSNLIIENPSLLFLLEFFEIDDVINDKTVFEICKQYNINTSLFLVLANLYNNFSPNQQTLNFSSTDIKVLINFLNNTHQFYINDKYPEIQTYIKQLYNKQNKVEIERIELFFNDYFDEVIEHFRFEDDIVFPYFLRVINKDLKASDVYLSVKKYKEEHSDIETKLSDLKKLLVKHIKLKGDFPLKRKIINALFEFENDLTIHSTIEEQILIPLIENLENK